MLLDADILCDFLYNNFQNLMNMRMEFSFLNHEKMLSYETALKFFFSFFFLQ